MRGIQPPRQLPRTASFYNPQLGQHRRRDRTCSRVHGEADYSGHHVEADDRRRSGDRFVRALESGHPLADCSARSQAVAGDRAAPSQGTKGRPDERIVAALRAGLIVATKKL